MKKKRLIWHIYPSFVLLSALAMIAVAISASRIARNFHYEQTEKELTNATYLIVEQLKAGSVMDTGLEIDMLCQSLAQKTGYRVTVILPSGVVAGDSEKNPATMDNHGGREEVQGAQTKGIGRSIRYSDTLKEDMLYVAMPLAIDGESKGTVRTALSLAKIDEALVQMWWKIFLAGLVIALIAMVSAALIARRISRPLERIRLSGESFGQGGQYEKLPSSGISEVDVLTNTLNIMADQLDARIQTIKRQHDEQSALLSCMVESVLAVDGENKIIRMNQSAEELFQVDAASSLGKNIMEVIRNSDLLELVNRSLASSDPQEKEIFLSDTDRILLGTGSALHEPNGERIGAVIVLNDMARMRRLENLRRDFVGNVSHELKTPVTSIKGFVETLLDGAMEEPEEARRFLNIIAQQSNRLNSIIEDLLSLSRIEEYGEKRKMSLEKETLKPVLVDALELCQAAAEKKGITIELLCAEDLDVEINSLFLEQAIVNLVNNAVKYSGPGSKIHVTVTQEEESFCISVRDNGPGIEPKHLSRIFERFYVVDKARSRKLGGTGLGLAIVKHVAQAHGGQVTVESEVGKGSIFTITIPISA
jgi:two-component system, OmpR family, phosphate regulon sensor histidine kinase PhoR